MQDLQKQLLSGYNIEVRSYENNTVKDIPQFLKEIDGITSLVDGSIIQLLDCDYICGKRHLNQGISHAVKAFNENQNFAKDRGLEICVRTSAQKQISQALRILGIKNVGNVTVVYVNASGEQIEKVEELLSARNDALLEEYDVEKICGAYGVESSDNVVDVINEKIALLALKN
ncbi:MAG: hypothetical protein BZ135_07030 [Methanosphaera sp. rholeuAM6]|nr:MAG: hypothetical protein BZ135_07030 [Methanosphaera sp. rholeuAM6]